MTETETTKITPEVVEKQELVKRIAKQTDVTQKQVGEIFDLLDTVPRIMSEIHKIMDRDLYTSHTLSQSANIHSTRPTRSC